MREKEQLGCLRVRDRLLPLEKMYYDDEIRPRTRSVPTAAKGGKRSSSWPSTSSTATGVVRPVAVRGHVRRAAPQGDQAEEPREDDRGPAPEPNEAEEAPDLLSALRESVERARTRTETKRQRASTNGSKLDDHTVAEAAKLAGKLGIEGRSRMTKRELVGAILKVES